MPEQPEAAHFIVLLMITWRAWLVGLVADCVGACDARCSEHSHKKRCSRSCLTCCSACRCVPAGTAGNRETCGRCYTDWVSHNNMTKCP